MQKVWILVDLPYGKREIGTKWVYRNKKDERGIVIKNKARLVAQGHTQEEGIDYEEVFAPAARNEAIRLFLAYASFIGFLVYQMDVKSAFVYDTIEEEVNVLNPHIYGSCIKQFWNTALVKRSDDVTSDLSTHTTSYISPALTQKVFANMRWVRKDFSGVETPLFEGMLTARQLAEEGIAEEQVQADDAVAAVI
nr:copia protein [Tanacetum cinerariifolium]